MEMQQYFDQKKELYNILLAFLDSDSQNEEDLFQKLTTYINNHKIVENRREMIDFFHIVQEIYKNHHSDYDLFSKTTKIIIHFEEKIKQTLSNHDLFDIFKNCKKILLFLFQKKFILINDDIVKLIFNKNSRDYDKRYKKRHIEVFFDGNNTQSKEIHTFYHIYFYHQIKFLYDEEEIKFFENQLNDLDSTILNDFDEKCEIGENESFICKLIRNDSVDEFISYVNKTNFPLSSEVKQSVFETNPLLLEKEATLIEYAAFFGSIKIFQYLKNNHVQMTPSLWIYAIHSKNAELINILEESCIDPPDKSYLKCFEESIKCHHNEIADYIKENLLNENDTNKIEKEFEKNEIAFALHYCNFYFLPNDLNDKYLFLYFCHFNYIKPVELFLKENKDYNIYSCAAVFNYYNF